MRIGKQVRGALAAIAVVSVAATTVLTQGRRQQYNLTPFHIVGNINYVGLSDNTAFLFKTSQGAILLDTLAADAADEIRGNIEAMGVAMKDVKIIIQSHAHGDHIASLAKFNEWTGAKVVVMAEDAQVLADGGASDFRGNGQPNFTPVKADQIIHDGDTVQLGDVTLVAHLTPGHTKGCTSWSTDTTEAGRKYTVVFSCSIRMNTGIPLLNNPKYPNLVADLERAFKTMRSLKPDLFFVSHGNQFGMAERLERMKKGEGLKPFMEGYKEYLDEYETAFIEQLTSEQAGGSPYAVGTKPLPPCPQDGRKCYGV